MKRVCIALGIIFLAASMAMGQTTRPDFSKQKVLYVIGYAHLDTQWRWTYPIVIREYIRNTMEDNFPLIEKYPDYIFNFTGARRYQFMQQYFPADFKKLQQYVKEGRWFPAGASVDECDTDSPSCESLVRQILYGNEYFQKEFGVTSDDLMLPDSFGFTYALPEICAHCGLKGFSTQKLTWGSAVGIPFSVGTWEGPDGRSIIAALDPGAYSGAIDGDLSHSDLFLSRINKTGGESGVYVDYRYYGTGDRGGAPKESSVQALEESVHGTGPVHVIASTSDQMYKDISDAQKARLPHYKGELLLTWHSTGSISSESAMKRWNRKNELLADAAERASVAAQWLGTAAYPGQRLWNAWMIVLGSQMHDMMAGTAMANAYDYIWNDELLCLNQFGAITQDAVGAVALTMRTSAQGVSVVVFNPLGFARTDAADATIGYPTADAVPDDVHVVGPDGKLVISQTIGREGNKLHILFLATVPSVGFAAYDVQPGAVPMNMPRLAFGDQHHLENPRLSVTLDGDGDIASIVDKVHHREIFASPSRLEFLTEHPTDYPAWNMYYADQMRPPRAYVAGPATVQILENGPLRATLEVTRRAEGSKFVQRISVDCGLEAADWVEVANTIDWQTPESCLKASFPLSFGNPLAVYDCQISAIERGNDDPKKFEVPQQQWFDMDDRAGDFGVAVLNDCKYGSDKPDDSTLRLTLLYTPRARVNQYHDQATQDMGRQIMTYAIAPHAGDWRSANVPEMGARLNQPLLTFQCPSHDGPMGTAFSLLTVSSDHVAVQAMKKAEQGDEMIVRLRETMGRPANDVVVSSMVPFFSAREVDGQERPIGPASLDDRGEMWVNMAPYSLRAFAIKLGSAPPGVALLSRANAPALASVDLDFSADVVSSTAHPDEGAMDDTGHTYPAEEWPAELTVDGIPFRLGPAADGRKNAVICRGQKVPLPDGVKFDKVYLLAAAVDGDRKADFRIDDGRAIPLNIEDWSSPIGEWDTRLWADPLQEVDYGWQNECVGLKPGFVKPAEVAWFSTHRHERGDGNEFYHYCYMFKYELDAPSGGHELILPDDPNVVVFAVTVGRNGHDTAVAAMPLSDTLQDRADHEGPIISPPGG
ncbi:MAG TPA: glycoside hydrolase family 38 C-terminal domain-containing protein, partial [Tepidisphaeraceae bacterium]|nr:glycoside hydrolase family 38 C-terminal domain-containing protein [Tepidisphaeraceae bacterium]